MKYKKRQVRPAKTILRKIADEHKNGITTSNLARRFNTTLAYVAVALRTYIPLRERLEIASELRLSGCRRAVKKRWKHSVFKKARTDVRIIVELYDGGMSMRGLAEKYKVSPCFLQKIISEYRSLQNSGPREAPRAGNIDIARHLAAVTQPARIIYTCRRCEETYASQPDRCPHGGSLYFVREEFPLPLNLPALQEAV